MTNTINAYLEYYLDITLLLFLFLTYVIDKNNIKLSLKKLSVLTRNFAAHKEVNDVTHTDTVNARI